MFVSSVVQIAGKCKRKNTSNIVGDRGALMLIVPVLWSWCIVLCAMHAFISELAIQREEQVCPHAGVRPVLRQWLLSPVHHGQTSAAEEVNC